jgi:hypothetical protein
MRGMEGGRMRGEGERREAGTSSVEHLVLVVAVALGFAAAAVPLGALLLGYHELVERVLSLPIP